MDKLFLLPNRFKRFGWFILIPSLIAYVLTSFDVINTGAIRATVFAVYNGEFLSSNQYFRFIETDITLTLIGIFSIVGASLVSFSKEKTEDEFISGLRLNALLWAVAINYIILLLAFAFIYGTAFVDVMVYQMFTVLILFILRFHYLLYKHSKFAEE
jgi:hypothetical protein